MKKMFAVFLVVALLLTTGCSNVGIDNATETQVRSDLVKDERVTYPEDIVVLTDEQLRTMEDEVIQKTNEYRATKGLGALTYDADLAYVAKIRAREIVTCWSHTRPDGTRYVDILRAMNYDSRLVGENLGRYQLTTALVMEMWIESPGHEANLSGDFNKIGVCVYQSEEGLLHYVQIFAQ